MAAAATSNSGSTGPFAIQPCPAEVELELAVGGRLLFVSDLHLSGGGPTSDFAATDQFVELIDSLTGHPGPVMLVLGGDILDLLQAQAPTPTGTPGPKGPAAGGQQPEPGPLDRVLDGPDAVMLGRALRRLARRPDARIVYLVGNHDAELAWDAAARRRVADQFGASNIALRLRVHVEGGAGAPLSLAAEHGDAFDPYNRRTDPFDPLDSPPGQHVVVEVVNRLEEAALAHPDLALDQVNNPDGVVRGSGIFSGGWGADRARVYGVKEEQLGEYYAQRTLLKREILPEHVAEAVLALTSGSLEVTTGLLVPVDGGVPMGFLR